jgi:ABC-type sugar transport system substrate-binding protein
MTRGAIALVLLAGLLAACGGGVKRADVDPEDVRLGAVIKGLDNPFFVTMRDGLVSAAKRLKVPLRVAAAPAGLQDTAGQASELESIAAGHPACYVVNPITPANLIRALAGIPGDPPIVNVDSIIDARAADAVGVQVTSYIGTDNRAGGKLGADEMASLVGPGGKVALITGIPGDVGSRLRAAGFQAGTRGRFDVVTTIAADFERDKARRAAAELLRTDPHISGFFAVNDLMALGVADAVQDAGRGRDVDVVGFDGIPQALTAVRKGRLAATVAQYPYTIGQLGVEACMAAVRGRHVPGRVEAPVQLVTSENVERAQANFPRPVERFDDPFAP